MAGQSEFRRYLVNVESTSTHQLFADCLVIGAGIAGLRAAIEAAEHCNVIIVCKDSVKESNTWLAQGGIASVLDKTDTFESHIADTLGTGCGISDGRIVELVVRQGPELVEQLLRWGTKFDMIDGRIATTLEGGHSHARVAHAHGDQTGRMITEALIKKVRENPKIKIVENFYTVDLLTNDDNECIGIIGHDKRGPQIIWAVNTILATGGAGQLYRETTNPEVATGDGIAMAYRAGAVLQDLEFVQFHPTTLYIAGASRALITEALRGEGAVLLDSKARRFMKDYHESAELAPRDIVSRAILSQMLKTKSTHVFLDVRSFDKKHFAQRFPHINELCESFDIDISKDTIPVRPSAHYMIGGIRTDISGKTSVENLYACGEVAATGLHGANRLGSNSLLEGLVFGQITGEIACQQKTTSVAHIKHPPIKYQIPHSDRTRLDATDVRNSLRALMWRNVGITRKAKPLIEAQEIVRFWQRYVMDKIFDSPQGWECQNMLTVSLLMAQVADLRQESRGVHFRSDFPDTDDEHFKKHIEISRGK
ncbi:MAG: L-aspartate oxidase [Planctomycetota bacterium]|jgi:L-aspartate oxidase